MNNLIQVIMRVALVLALTLTVTIYAQDTPKSMLSLAKKQAALAKGQPKAEKEAAYKKAIDLYAQIHTKWPDASAERSKAHLATAALHKKLGNTKEALLNFNKVLEIKDRPREHADAYLAMASIHRKLKSFEEARANLNALIDRCANQDKDCARARLTLGSLARQEKRFVDAMKWASDVLEKHPVLWRENVDAVQLYLSVLIKNKHWAEAATEMTKFETMLLERYEESEKLAMLKRALAGLPARRTLTPVPITNNGRDQ